MGGCHFFLITSAYLRYAPLSLRNYALTSSFWLRLPPPPPYLSLPLSCESLSPHPPYIPLRFSILGLPPLFVLSTPFFFPLWLPFFGVGSSHPGLWGSPYPLSPLRYYSSADYLLPQVASGFRLRIRVLLSPSFLFPSFVIGANRLPSLVVCGGVVHWLLVFALPFSTLSCWRSSQVLSAAPYSAWDSFSLGLCCAHPLFLPSPTV